METAMLSHLFSLLVQAGIDQTPLVDQNSYDSVSQLIKVGFLFIVLLIVFRFIILLFRRSQQARESEAKILSMRHDMDNIAREKLLKREGNSNHLDEIK